MPIYEYECQQCGRRTERLQRIDDPPLAACPHCGGAVKKLFSAPAVQFKGSGWYVTDYAGRGKAKGSEGKEKEAAGGDKGEKTETKSGEGAKTPAKETGSAPSGGKVSSE